MPSVTLYCWSTFSCCVQNILPLVCRFSIKCKKWSHIGNICLSVCLTAHFTSKLLSTKVVTMWHYTGCPNRYQTRHLFNKLTTNEEIATKFVADLPHCVRNVKEKNVLLFKFRCTIFIGVRIIKEMPGSVASGTPCSCFIWVWNLVARSVGRNVGCRRSRIGCWWEYLGLRGTR
jgi:hypothetical protein